MWPKKGITGANPTENQRLPANLSKLKSRVSTDQTNNAHLNRQSRSPTTPALLFLGSFENLTFPGTGDGQRDSRPLNIHKIGLT